jgi:hypothetical protein
MGFLSSFSGSAVADLGLGGGNAGLGGQLAGAAQGETDEERKKRLLQMQQAKLMGPAGSLAAATLFGARGAPGGGMGGGSGAGY